MLGTRSTYIKAASKQEAKICEFLFKLYVRLVRDINGVKTKPRTLECIITFDAYLVSKGLHRNSARIKEVSFRFTANLVSVKDRERKDPKIQESVQY